MCLNKSIRVTEHLLHTSNEISTFSKIIIQKYQKHNEYVWFLNTSIRVTEHLLHTSNEISTFSKITIQTYQKTHEEYVCFLNNSKHNYP